MRMVIKPEGKEPIVIEAAERVLGNECERHLRQAYAEMRVVAIDLKIYEDERAAADRINHFIMDLIMELEDEPATNFRANTLFNL